MKKLWSQKSCIYCKYHRVKRHLASKDIFENCDIGIIKTGADYTISPQYFLDRRKFRKKSEIFSSPVLEKIATAKVKDGYLLKHAPFIKVIYVFMLKIIIFAIYIAFFDPILFSYGARPMLGDISKLCRAK